MERLNRDDVICCVQVEVMNTFETLIRSFFLNGWFVYCVGCNYVDIGLILEAG